MDLEKINTSGYDVIENIIPMKNIQYLRDYTMVVKNRLHGKFGLEKPVGSPEYWQGADMASKFPLSSYEENRKLYEFYTSDFMYDIVINYIPKPFLFNDQIVVKLPKEDFEFEPHRDNQHGPKPNDDKLFTINFMLVLDDINQENGGFHVKDKMTNEWISLEPKTGDIVLVEGNTYHRSFKNQSDNPRRVYICVYTNESIGKDFRNGFYYERFIK